MRWRLAWPVTALTAVVAATGVGAGLGLAYSPSSSSSSSRSATGQHGRLPFHGFEPGARGGAGPGRAAGHGFGGGGFGGGGKFGGTSPGGSGSGPGGSGGSGGGPDGGLSQGGLGGAGGGAFGGLLGGALSGISTDVTKDLAATGRASVTVTVNGTTSAVSLQEGTVEKVTASTIEIKSTGGYEHTYTATTATKVLSGSGTGSLTDIHTGTRATVVVVNGTLSAVESSPKLPGGDTPPSSPGTTPAAPPRPAKSSGTVSS